VTPTVTDRLLASSEPSVRYRVLLGVLGADLHSSEVRRLREKIRSSARVQRLLSERDRDGTIPFHPYAKWYGAHWVLSSLADLGYPPGDSGLVPLRQQVYAWLFGRSHEKRVQAIDGRVRRCASQEGNALYYLLALGLADARTDELARRLCQWQWPDGGWNCDKNPEAINSSFMESLIPLRGLSWHTKITGDVRSGEAARRTAEVFLKRRLFKRQADGSTIHEDFVRLHYPCYWHYDILFGLEVMAEAGYLADGRCQDALDRLESKRLSEGGFPAEKKYYQASGKPKTGRSLVDWGGTSKTAMNEWVTVRALHVLKESGRLA
jgi:hypothetical protein